MFKERKKKENTETSIISTFLTNYKISHKIISKSYIYKLFSSACHVFPHIMFPLFGNPNTIKSKLSNFFLMIKKI